MSISYILKRIRTHPNRLKKVFRERITEPLHLNVLSVFVALVGTFRAKVDFDLVVRQQYAFPILYAADQASKHGIKKLVIAEFGVASGAGLVNICMIASKVTKATGIEFKVFGFDTGSGMPPAIDYRDHPEIWQEGDFPIDIPKLRAALPSFAQLLIGDLETTIPQFLEQLSPDAPLAFVSIDVDYYSSTVKVLDAFKSSAEKYLPMTMVYLDDITMDTANPWCGESLAISEFNESMRLRKIAPFAFLRAQRIFKNARWIDMIYGLHVLDHERRTPRITRDPYVTPNEYIGFGMTERSND